MVSKIWLITGIAVLVYFVAVSAALSLVASFRKRSRDVV